jgi:hypothetical protein
MRPRIEAQLEGTRLLELLWLKVIIDLYPQVASQPSD